MARATTWLTSPILTSITDGDVGLEAIAPLRSGGGYSNLRLAAVNERVRGGISTVPTGQFGTGRSRPVGVDGQTFRGGRMIAGNLPVVPTRAALSVSNRPAAASTLPRGGEQQRFFSKTRPAVAPPSFDRQVSQMRQSMQRNGAGTSPSFSSGPSQTSSAARPSPGFRTPAGNIPSGAQQAERGASSSNERTGRPAASDGSGWRRFSDSNTAQRDGRMNRPSGASPGASSVARPGNSAGPAASTTDGGWRHFTPQSGGNVQGSPDRTNNGGGMGGRGSDYPSRYEMSRPQMESVGGRGISQDSPRGYSRPPLEMRQPIVTPRASEVRGSAPRESSPARGAGGGGGGGGNRGGSGGAGGSHGGGPHGGSGRH